MRPQCDVPCPFGCCCVAFQLPASCHVRNFLTRVTLLHLPSTADWAGVTEQGSHRLRWYNRSLGFARWLAEMPFNEMLAIYLLIF